MTPTPTSTRPSVATMTMMSQAIQPKKSNTDTRNQPQDRVISNEKATAAIPSALTRTEESTNTSTSTVGKPTMPLSTRQMNLPAHDARTSTQRNAHINEQSQSTTKMTTKRSMLLPPPPPRKRSWKRVKVHHAGADDVSCSQQSISSFPSWRQQSENVIVRPLASKLVIPDLPDTPAGSSNTDLPACLSKFRRSSAVLPLRQSGLFPFFKQDPVSPISIMDITREQVYDSIPTFDLF